MGFFSITILENENEKLKKENKNLKKKVEELEEVIKTFDGGKL